MMDTNNISPWDSPNAFNPMYDECMSITSSDKTKTYSCRCCVFADNTSDPETDDFLNSNNESVIIGIQACDWLKIQAYKRGDRIKIYSRRQNYAVQEVTNDYLLGMVVKAKTVA